MQEVNTKYCLLKGISYLDYYHNGGIKNCVLAESNEIITPYGVFIPQYLDDGLRRKQIKPLNFHQNGSIKNLPLQNQENIVTSIGTVSAEFISFYENGNIRRVFPLDGKLTGFWTEEDEYEMAAEFEFNLACGRFQKKFIGLQFYAGGQLKSITFWPKDTVSIQTPLGQADTRIGISLYPDGQLMSYEPSKPQLLKTPIGSIMAYDSTAMGIHGEANSVRFFASGEIEQVVTSTNIVEVIDAKGQVHLYKPGSRDSLFNAAITEFVPMVIRFNEGKVCFNNSSQQEYRLDQCTFTIKQLQHANKNQCSSCSGCTECG